MFMTKKVVKKAPRMPPPVEIKIVFLHSNTEEGLLFEQSFVTQVINVPPLLSL